VGGVGAHSKPSNLQSSGNQLGFQSGTAANSQTWESCSHP